MAMTICASGLISCNDDSGAFLNTDHESIVMPATGGTFALALETNVEDWTYRFEYGDWLTATVVENNIVVSGEYNANLNNRASILTITSSLYPEVNKRITITQSPLRLTLEPSELQMFPTDGQGYQTMAVSANMPEAEWTIIDDPYNGWITAEKVTGGVKITVEPNLELLPRSGTVTVESEKYPGLNTAIPVSQLGTLDDIDEIILFESFGWLVVPGADNIWTTSGEKRVDTWIANYGEQAEGWSYTQVTTGAGNNEPLSFSRNGYVKMNITNYVGDLITPKLTALEGERTIEVFFRACGYVEDGTGASYAGRKDPIKGGVHIDVPNLMTIAVIGPGTPSHTRFDIDNYPYSPATADHGPDYIWQNDTYASLRSFTVTGATAETRIQFIGGPALGYNDGVTYRKGLDDILVITRK